MFDAFLLDSHTQKNPLLSESCRRAVRTIFHRGRQSFDQIILSKRIPKLKWVPAPKEQTAAGDFEIRFVDLTTFIIVVALTILNIIATSLPYVRN